MTCAKLLLCTVAALSAVVAKADTINLKLDPNFPGNYHYYSYTDPQGGAQGQWVGPYPAFVSGGAYGAGAWYYVFCHDIHVDTNVGVTYTGHVIKPTTRDELIASYMEDKVFKAGGFNAPVNTVGGPYSLGVWEIMFPTSVHNTSTGYSFAPDTAAAALIAEAEAAVDSGQWTAAKAAKYAIWMPDNPEAAQRFGLLGTVITPVPEPGSMVMTGLGALAILAGSIRRRRREGSGLQSTPPVE